MNNSLKRLATITIQPWTAAFVAAILLIGLLFQALIPPFQSPDEFSHVKRAYMLSKGRIFLSHPPGQQYAGSDIDNGLLAYFEVYKTLPYTAANKFSQEEKRAGEQIKWAHAGTFSPAPGTGYYFPAAYLPQAIGLSIGEQLDLSIHDTYKLTRVITFASTLAVLVLAFAVFPASPLLPALLVLPMNLLQLLSASLDGFTTALTILALSLFVRLSSRDKTDSPAAFLHGMCACLFIVATSRIHMLPLIALPLFIYFSSRNRSALIYFFALTASTIAWTALSIKASYIALANPGASTGSIIHFYAERPGSVIQLILTTIQDEKLAEFYTQSFIGVLGWLDTYFTLDFYATIVLFIQVIALLSLSLDKTRQGIARQVFLLFIAATSAIFVFLALLLTWNPLMPNVIAGIQGRYFVAPAIVFIYALSGSARFCSSRARKIAAIALACMTAYSLEATATLMVERYFLVEKKDPGSIITLKIP